MQRCNGSRTCRPTLPLLQRTAKDRYAWVSVSCTLCMSCILTDDAELSWVQPCCRTWPLPRDSTTRPAPNRQASPGCAALRTAVPMLRPPTRHNVEVVQALIDLAGQYLDSRVAAAAAGVAGQGEGGGRCGGILRSCCRPRRQHVCVPRGGGMLRRGAACKARPCRQPPLLRAAVEPRAQRGRLTCGECPLERR